MHYSKFMKLLLRVVITASLLTLVACTGKGLKKVEVKDASLTNFEQDYRAAITLIKEGAFKEAAEKFAVLSQQHPRYPGPYVNAGIAWYRLGDLDLAKTSFEQVLMLAAQQELVESKERKEQLEQKVSIHAFLLVAQNYLGLIARESGEFSQAEAHYRKALAIDSEHPTTIKNLAILLDLYQGKVADAVVLYEKYQSLLDEPDAQVKDWIFDINARLERGGS